MSDVRPTIEGIQELQDANLRAMAALQPTGAYGRALQYVTIGLHRYAVDITHVDTGALKASHRMDIQAGAGRAEVYIDPSAVNPYGKRPFVYGEYEHRRGGEHAFYDRTIEEAGPRLLDQGLRMIANGTGL